MASTARPFALAPPPAIFQQRRVDVLLSLQQAAQQIASILELDELLDTIVHRIAVDFGCIESSILLVDGDEFHLAAVHGCTQSNKGERWPVTRRCFGEGYACGVADVSRSCNRPLLGASHQRSGRDVVASQPDAVKRLSDGTLRHHDLCCAGPGAPHAHLRQRRASVALALPWNRRAPAPHRRRDAARPASRRVYRAHGEVLL